MRYIHLYTLFLMLVCYTSCEQKQTNPPQDKFSKEHTAYYESQLKEMATSKVPRAQVRHIKQARNGDILIAATWSGAFRYDGKSFQTFTTKDGLPNNDITTIMEDKTGKLWFGAKLENMFVYDGKTFTVLKNKDGKAFKNVWSIIEDKKGNIWTTGAVNPNGVGVWALSRYDAKSLYNKMPTVTEIKSGKIMAFLGILEANDGSIWFGSAPGVYRYDGKTFTDFKSAAGQK